MARGGFERTDRIAALLRREVATLVHEDVKSHQLPEISVSDVEVSRDLAVAKVFVTALNPEDAKPALALLKEEAKRYRQALSKLMSTRTVPELRFHYDDSVDRGGRIDELLRQSRAADDSIG
ncbi:MAG: 30S ribosome-binding factor RbfA [Lysobacterales bacterium]